MTRQEYTFLLLFCFTEDLGLLANLWLLHPKKAEDELIRITKRSIEIGRKEGLMMPKQNLNHIDFDWVVANQRNLTKLVFDLTNLDTKEEIESYVMGEISQCPGYANNPHFHLDFQDKKELKNQTPQEKIQHFFSAITKLRNSNDSVFLEWLSQDGILFDGGYAMNKSDILKSGLNSYTKLDEEGSYFQSQALSLLYGFDYYEGMKIMYKKVTHSAWIVVDGKVFDPDLLVEDVPYSEGLWFGVQIPPKFLDKYKSNKSLGSPILKNNWLVIKDDEDYKFKFNG